MIAVARQHNMFAEAHQSLARITARDYQQAGIDNTFALWRDHVGVLFRQPTGTGKTVSGTLIADRWMSLGNEHRVLVLAHERELIKQFADEIQDILGIRPAIEMAERHCTGRERLIVASRQTLKGYRLAQKFDPSLKWLLIIDEAHRWAMKLASCRPIIEHFAQNPDHRRLGLTATPERTDKIKFSALFPGVASDYRLYNLDGGPSAVGDGWAVPYDQRFVVVEGVDFKRIREVAKDFDKAELEKVLTEQETLVRLVDPTLELVGDRRTLIFNPGVDMAKAVALYINAKLGYEAAIQLDGSFPDEERSMAYRRHKRGDVQFLSVCGLCREGYNDPGIQAVAIYRPTKSRPLAEQMKGRGCRPLKGVVTNDMTGEQRLAAIAASAKPTCMIVDLVGVTGLADCASTAHILAAGKPDEVIERANKNALKKTGPVDMAEEIRQAERELEAEQEKKLKRREQQAKYRAARKAREQQDEDEYRRRNALEPSVNYHATKVGIGRGGKVESAPSISSDASDKQRGFIKRLGLDLGDAVISKKQASRIIGQLKSGVPVHVVKKTNRLEPKPMPTTINDFHSLLNEFRSL